MEGQTYALRALLHKELDQIEARREAIFSVIRGLDAVCQHPDQSPSSGVMMRCDECQSLVS